MEAALAIALGGLFAAAFTYPIVLHLSLKSMATNDWDQQLEYAWTAWYSAIHFKQIPHWDPYKCGGLPLLADPQVRVLTPFFLLHLMFGPIVGVHLEAILHVTIAWIGGYYLGRQIGLEIIPSMVCASLFPGSSWMYLHLAEGHLVFMALEYLPWMLMLWLRGIDSGRTLPLAIGGLIGAIAFAESGIYVVYLTIPLMLAVTVVLSTQNRSIGPWITLTEMGLFGIGFGAVKLLPVLGLGIVRITDSMEWVTPSILLQVLFSRDQSHDRYINGMFWGFHEYGAYVEPLFAVLAVLGATRYFKRAAPWLAAALLTLALSLGSPVWWAPWALLHQLPLYSYEHAPTRFLIPFVMALSPLAGLGAQAVISRYRGWPRPAIVILLLAALVDGVVVVNPNLLIALQGQPEVIDSSPIFRQYRNPKEREMYSIARSNQGALNCYAHDTLGFNPTGYNDPGYRGEQYLISPGTVTLTRWTPNQLTYHLDLPGSSVLVVNQNFDGGWMVVEGAGLLFNRQGLIAVDLPKGKQQLRLVYHTRFLGLGLSISLMTLIVTLGLGLYENNRLPEALRPRGFRKLAVL
jgi:hypothetical protein